jgi:hypothetical protein
MLAMAVFADYLPGGSGYPGMGRWQVFGAAVGVGLVVVVGASPRSVSRVRVATFFAAWVLATAGFVIADYPPFGSGYLGMGMLQALAAAVGVGVVLAVGASPRGVSRVRVAMLCAAWVLAAAGFVMLALAVPPVLCPDCEDPFREFEPCGVDPNPKKLSGSEFRELGGCL